MLMLERDRFNRSIQHLENITGVSSRLVDQNQWLTLSINEMRNAYYPQMTNLSMQLEELQKRIHDVETRPSPFLTNHEYTIRITPASRPAIKADQVIKAESAPMPWLNLGRD